jgi:ubiquinone/menaquinone biosynthesis C-methylase UbiE
MPGSFSAALDRVVTRMRLARERGSATYSTWWNAASASRAGAYATTYVADDETDYRSRGWNGDANSFGAKQFIEMAELGPTSRVLEIGCGAARVGREMAAKVGEWHGADISSNMLAFARQRTEGLPNVFLHQLGEPNLAGFADESFDFVYATTVFMHLDKEDIFQYLIDARRVLRAGGYAFFDTWNLLNPDTYRQWRSIQRDNAGMKKSRGRIQFSTAAEWRAYLDDAGFEILRLDEEKLLRVLCRRTPIHLHDPNDGLAPFGYVDEPRNESKHRQVLVVRGWVLDDVERIEAALDGCHPLGTCGVGLPRPDVAPLFPRYPGAGACGYELRVPLEEVAPGHHTLQVRATDRSGRTTGLSGEYLGLTIER